jgi:hypothetical protein
MNRRLLPLVAIVLVVTAPPVLGYLKLGSRVQGQVISLRWEDLPIRYFVTDQAAPGVSAQQFQQTIARAFGTWDAVETAQTSSEFAGFTQAIPDREDGITVLGFDSRPELERVLGATQFTVDVTSGEIIESDIFFNSAFPWSIAASGETGRFDLESIAVHEIGHLLGLGHSALGETEVRPGGRRVIGAESVMFPIAFAAGSTADRVLKPDDIAGISDVYPTSEFRVQRGSISGRVTKDGQGVFGAHVVAFNPRTGALVGGFSLSDDGAFTIGGLEAGPHVLRAEPLDDGDLESFFNGDSDVDSDFNVRFHDRVIVVPRGGGATNVDIRVTPR